MRKQAVLLVYVLFFFSGINAQKLQINFNHFVNDEPLKLDSTTYKNEFGQMFTVSKFKYYISNFQFKTSTGKVVSTDATFLIDEDEPGSKTIQLENIPTENYTSLDFIIGVDSLHNCSGAQSGALDPINAMFWAWNTGYIFLKLEGRSSASKSPGNFFEYHIGGYKQPNNCIRKVTLDITNKINSRTLDLKANIIEILKTPTPIDFEKLSSVTDHKNATIIADNYSNMFEVLKK